MVRRCSICHDGQRHTGSSFSSFVAAGRTLFAWNSWSCSVTSAPAHPPEFSFFSSTPPLCFQVVSVFLIHPQPPSRLLVPKRLADWFAECRSRPTSEPRQAPP